MLFLDLPGRIRKGRPESAEEAPRAVDQNPSIDATDRHITRRSIIGGLHSGLVFHRSPMPRKENIANAWQTVVHSTTARFIFQASPCSKHFKRLRLAWNIEFLCSVPWASLPIQWRPLLVPEHTVPTLTGRVKGTMELSEAFSTLHSA